MKIALILYGIHYNECIHHWAGSYYGIDYRVSIDNYKKYLWEYFKDDTIDIFFSTYQSKLSKKLVQDYEPKAYNFFPDLKYTKRTKRIGKNSNMIKATELCLNYNKKKKIKYNLCIVTRFDLIFKNSLSDTLFDSSKFNVSFKLKSINRICDNFYIMPFKYLNKFHKIIIDYGISNNHHYLIKILDKQFKINYLFKENYSTLHNKFYYINRIVPSNEIIAKLKKKEKNKEIKKPIVKKIKKIKKTKVPINKKFLVRKIIKYVKNVVRIKK